MTLRSIDTPQPIKYNLPGYRRVLAKENVSAQENTPSARARLPVPDEHQGRTASAEGATAKRQEEANCSIGLDRRRRLSDAKRLAVVSKEGRRWYNALLGLKAQPNMQGTTRFAFRVGKHVGKAVERNRVKRLMREATRSMPVREGWDVILSARVGARSSDFWQVRRALEEVLARARLLVSPTVKTDPKE